MCDPVTVAVTMAVVSGGMAVHQTSEQDKAAKAANRANDMQYEEEIARAERDAQNSGNQLTAEVLQESTKYQQQRQQLALASLRESANARTASAESGVGGVTASRSFLAEDLATGQAEADVRTSMGFTDFNVQQRARGIAASKRDRGVNADFTHVAQTRKRASGLDFAIAGVSGFMEGGGGAALGSLGSGTKAEASSSPTATGG